jgi:hypothetical protein
VILPGDYRRGIKISLAAFPLPVYGQAPAASGSVADPPALRGTYEIRCPA